MVLDWGFPGRLDWGSQVTGLKSIVELKYSCAWSENDTPQSITITKPMKVYSNVRLTVFSAYLQ